MTKRKHKTEPESSAAAKATEKKLRSRAGNADAETQADDNEVIRPYGQKIGEGPGNLRQREQWFQRRSGNRK